MRAITTVFIYLSLIGFSTYGIIFIYSSTTADQAEKGLHFSTEFNKQLVFFVIGFFLLWGVSHIPYKKIMEYALAFYICNILLLLYVKFFGVIAGGARSWIDLGFIRYQPSEVMKISWILYLASYLRYKKNITSAYGLFMPFLITSIPVLLIISQPDYGTASIFIPTLFLILYITGAKKRHLILITLSFCLLTVPMYFFVLSPNQKQRIDGFLYPDQYQQSASYQPNHAKLAIGEGGLFGKGVGNSRINQLSLLPESHTDFIFAIVASELGFLGAMGLVFCFVLFLLALCLLAVYTREPYGRITTMSFCILIGTQTFVNLFVTLGLLPTTGVTLPFISSGGSSFLACCLIVGIVLSVSKHPIAVLGREDFSQYKV